MYDLTGLVGITNVLPLTLTNINDLYQDCMIQPRTNAQPTRTGTKLLSQGYYLPIDPRGHNKGASKGFLAALVIKTEPQAPSEQRNTPGGGRWVVRGWSSKAGLT